MGNPPSCLVPCPVCGNGVTEFPETCDTSGTPASCDGCSRFCEIENCNDQSACTTDSCDPILGCRHELMPTGTLCRAAAGPCDLPETCTGSSPTCPHDVFKPGTAVCRDSAGICDPAETCTGSGPDCPADALASAGTVCRASTGACDIAETCTGANAACPADALASTGTVCRLAAGDCDAEETCTGVSPTCPIDAFRPAGTSCDDGNACTIDDECNAGGSCLGDPMTCGDGVVQEQCDEECDDGGTLDGDGCSGTCEVEPCFACVGEPSACNPDVGAACDDGDICTNGDSCTASASCVGEERPRTGCRKPYQPQKALLVVKDTDPDKADMVLFRWIQGEQTLTEEFGTPTWKTDYALCLYDESAGTPKRILKLEAPAGARCKKFRPCWKQNRTGFNYNDAERSREGLQTLQLKAGMNGKAKVQVKASGGNLPVPTLPLQQDSTVTAQVIGSNGLCFEADFSNPSKVNRQDLFKDKAD